MRRKLLLGAVLAGFLSLSALTSYAAWPTTLQSGGDVQVKKGQTTDGSFYGTGEKVTIAGVVDGDLYCAGGTVVISGTVKGDVLCAAQSIEITGSVTQDARLAGQNIKLDSDIGGSVSVFGQNVLMPSGSIAGDLNGVAQSLEIDGTIGQNVVYGAARVIVRGDVKGDASISAEAIELRDGSTVIGDLFYNASSELDINKNAVVGDVTYNPPSESGDSDSGGFAFGLVIGAMLIASAIVVALLAPRFMVRSDQIAREDKLMTVLVGFGAAFGAPIIAFAMMFTIVLIPLAISILFVWALILSLSGIFFAYLVGSKLLSSSPNTVMRMAGGAVVVVLLYIIPVINILTFLSAIIVGSGMIVRTLTYNYQKPRYNISDNLLIPDANVGPAVVTTSVKKPAAKPKTDEKPKKK